MNRNQIMKSTIIPSILSGILIAGIHPSQAAGEPGAEPVEGGIALYASDGSAPALGVEAVNRRLAPIGVRVGRVPIPAAARPILRASASRALTPDEATGLIRHFHLGRRELLDEIRRAGRVPEMHRGGYLATSEVGIAPYPKVYDMRALDPATVIHLQEKFGRLHVNSSEAGVGIDEVMTIVAGGPYTWFFALGDGVVGKLRFGAVGETGEAWRISYPGLVPHGGYFDAAHGLVVAYAHGPEHFVMRYEDPSVDDFEILGDNPWIDFKPPTPRLLERPRNLQPAQAR
jgi:hypothetical protein